MSGLAGVFAHVAESFDPVEAIEDDCSVEHGTVALYRPPFTPSRITSADGQ